MVIFALLNDDGLLIVTLVATRCTLGLKYGLHCPMGRFLSLDAATCRPATNNLFFVPERQSLCSVALSAGLALNGTGRLLAGIDANAMLST